MAVAQTLWMDTKDAWLSSRLTPALRKFDMSQMCTYFIILQSDFKSVREGSFKCSTEDM